MGGTGGRGKRKEIILFRENFPIVKPALPYKENVSIKSLAHFTWGFGGLCLYICIRQSMYRRLLQKFLSGPTNPPPPSPQFLRPSIKEPRIDYYRISMNGGKKEKKLSKEKEEKMFKVFGIYSS